MEVIGIYSWEIKKFVEERNYELTPEETNYVINVNNSPQISEIRYHPHTNMYELFTNDGLYVTFSVKILENIKKVC